MPSTTMDRSELAVNAQRGQHDPIALPSYVTGAPPCPADLLANQVAPMNGTSQVPLPSRPM